MNTPTHDLRDDAPRYVAEALQAAGRPCSIDELAESYDPPRPNNMADIRAELRDGSIQASNDDAKLRLIEDAVERLIEYSGAVVADGSGDYRLADGVDLNLVPLRPGEPLIIPRMLPDLFTPDTGLWAGNIRSADLTDNDAKDRELRESMRAHGWLPHLPAIDDENGVRIVGHRRTAVAAQLGIDPIVKVVRFGEGPAGDAARAALAIASNVGGKPLSVADRKKIAADLYGDGTKFSQEEIGKLLKVSAMTVSRDLRGLTDVKPPPARGGRPRKESAPKPAPISEPKPELQPEPAPAAPPDLTVVPGGLTANTPGQTDRVKEALARAKAKPEPARTDEDTPAPKPEPLQDDQLAGLVTKLRAMKRAGREALSLALDIHGFDQKTKRAVVIEYVDGMRAILDAIAGAARGESLDTEIRRLLDDGDQTQP